MNRTSKSGEPRAPIAIIGIAGQYGRAETLEMLHQNLCLGVDAVGPLTPDRKAHSAIADGQHLETGHLTRVDLFDHQYFGLSLGEAEHIDPQHRLLLETTCIAIQNAGYAPRAMRGTRTAVVFSSANSSYYMTYLLGDTSAKSVFGNAPAMAAGRVSYLLDLRGPAMMIDTTCSSSLMAVHEACNKLWLDEADCAIAGGANIKASFEDQVGGWGVEVLARNGKSKTFDASADGTGVGEGVGVVLLKRLPDAIADGDVIHAVILSSAANNDGGRSNGMTAPSSDAQAEVLLRAWTRAAIDAEDLGFVEVHGTGTRIGDPIELAGLKTAFATSTDRAGFCALSSLKANIGHTGYAAGIAGLTKVVLSLKSKKLYPTINFKTLNPLIDLKGAAVYVNTELRDWPRGPKPRRAGVSAFGMSGTNVHVVVEEAPELPAKNRDARERAAGPQLVTVSARTAPLLERYIRLLIPAIKSSDVDLADLAFTLNAGRDDQKYREAFVVNDRGALVAAMSGVLAGAIPPGPGIEGRELALLFPGEGDIGESTIEAMHAAHPAAKLAIDECLAHAKRFDSPALRVFAALYAWSSVLGSLGLTTKTLIGCAVGNFVTGVLRGKLELGAALKQAVDWVPPAEGFNREQLKKVLDGMQARGMPLFVELGSGSAFAEEVKRHASKPIVRSLALDVPRDALLRELARIYRYGVDLDWDSFYRGAEVRRVELPAVPFERTRCWLVEPLVAGATAAAPVWQALSAVPTKHVPVRIDGEGVTDTLKRLAAIWGEILKVESLRPDTDFEDVGGDSLSALDIAARVEQELGVRLHAQDFVDHPRLSSLAIRIDALLGVGAGASVVP